MSSRAKLRQGSIKLNFMPVVLEGFIRQKNLKSQAPNWNLFGNSFLVLGIFILH